MNHNEFLRLKKGDKVVLQENGLSLVFLFLRFIVHKKERSRRIGGIIATDIVYLGDISTNKQLHDFCEMNGRQIRRKSLRPGREIMHIDSGFTFTVVYVDRYGRPFVTCVREIPLSYVPILQRYVQDLAIASL